MISFTPFCLPFLSSVLVSQLAVAVPTSCDGSSGPNQECSTYQHDTVLFQRKQKQVRVQTVADDSASKAVGSHEAVGTCRFARIPKIWDELSDPSQTDLHNDYVSATLRWDGKFASPGAAVSMNGMTRDHILLKEDGEIKRIAGYSAPSKENLHIGMLAVVLDDESPVAWNFVIDYALSLLPDAERTAERTDAELREIAKTEAFRQLTTIIGEYERWREYCPACGGLINWFWVDDEGIIHDQGSGEKVKGVPALDNGQMAWSMVAVHQVLIDKAAAFTESGDGASADLYTALATRYQAQIDAMAGAVGDLFVNEPGHQRRSASRVNVKKKDAEVGTNQMTVKQKGMLRDPFEGELMIMFETLMGVGVEDSPTANKKLWKKVKKGVLRKEFKGPDGCLPAGVGSITAESGWRFSAHEQWKYLVMPYTDVEIVDRLFKNNERARSWDAHCRKLPGLLAAAYRPPHYDSASGEPVYMDTFGIPALSYGFTEPAVEDRVVTPYGAFPLIMASRGLGLAWHRSMLAHNKMQSPYGSMESFETNPVGEERPALMLTWDTKVTTDLAMVGGTTSIIRRALIRLGLYDKFKQILIHQMDGFGEINGEDAGFAPAPPVPKGAESFQNCEL